MRLQPEQFWSLTPALFNALVEGHYRRRRQELEREAQWVCTLVNHFPMRGKNARSLRVEQLIGFSDEEKKQIAKRRAQQQKAAEKKDT